MNLIIIYLKNLIGINEFETKDYCRFVKKSINEMQNIFKSNDNIAVLCTLLVLVNIASANILQPCCFVLGITGAEHCYICRSMFVLEVKGAAHRNILNNKLNSTYL